MALEDSEWSKATQFFDTVLNIDAKYAPAYVGLPLFPNASSFPRNVLFSKMLSMTFTPHYEVLREETLKKKLPEEFPPKLLDKMYSLEPPTHLSSVCVTPDQYYKQKTHADTLLTFLQKAAPKIAGSDWWKQWFSKKNNADPRYGTHEYWFIPLFVTLGRDRRSIIPLESRGWNDVRLRILFINNSMYMENISLDTTVEIKYGGTGDGTLHSLRPFRPVPLCSGFFVQKEGAVLRFE